jgi:hypothetical protein
MKPEPIAIAEDESVRISREASSTARTVDLLGCGVWIAAALLQDAAREAEMTLFYHTRTVENSGKGPRERVGWPPRG